MEIHKVELGSASTADQVHQMVRMITLQAMAKDTGSQVDALAIGVGAVAAAIEGVAAIVGQRAGIDHTSSEAEQKSTVNDVSCLVAALLVSRATHHDHEGDGTGEVGFLKMEMNPITYLAAIRAAEQILGRNIDSMINPRMLEAARKWEGDHGYLGWELSTAEKVGGTGRRSSLH